MMAEVVNVDEELLDVLLSDELVAVDEDELVLSVLLVACLLYTSDAADE